MHTRFLIPAVLLALAGCSSPASDEETWAAGDDEEITAPSRAEVRTLLQNWFDANLHCTQFFPVPHDIPADAEHRRKQMQAFVDAGLLRMEGELSLADPNSGSGQRRVIRYAATPEGEKQFRPGTGVLKNQKTVLCYGRPEVKIDNVGDPDTNFSRLDVTYRYRLTDIPAWARSPSILAFYPGFQERLEREEEEHQTLYQEDGKWVLERPPSLAMFDLQQLSR